MVVVVVGEVGEAGLEWMLVGMGMMVVEVAVAVMVMMVVAVVVAATAVWRTAAAIAWRAVTRWQAEAVVAAGVAEVAGMGALEVEVKVVWMSRPLMGA